MMCYCDGEDTVLPQPIDCRHWDMHDSELEEDYTDARYDDDDA